MRYRKTSITVALMMLMFAVSGFRAGSAVATMTTSSRMGPELPSASAMGPELPAQDATGERAVLSLERAIELGLVSDETLKQAGESVRGAEATVREAKSGRIPTIDFMARYGRNILKPVMFLHTFRLT